MPKTPGVALYAKRQRWTEQDARAVFAAHVKSGLSLAAFARDTGIGEQRLYYWRHRLELGSTPPAPPFVELRHGGTEVVEIALRSGRSVRVPATIDSAVLRRLVNALEQESSC